METAQEEKKLNATLQRRRRFKKATKLGDDDIERLPEYVDVQELVDGMLLCMLCNKKYAFFEQMLEHIGTDRHGRACEKAGYPQLLFCKSRNRLEFLETGLPVKRSEMKDFEPEPLLFEPKKKAKSAPNRRRRVEDPEEDRIQAFMTANMSLFYELTLPSANAPWSNWIGCPMSNKAAVPPLPSADAPWSNWTGPSTPMMAKAAVPHVEPPLVLSYNPPDLLVPTSAAYTPHTKPIRPNAAAPQLVPPTGAAYTPCANSNKPKAAAPDPVAPTDPEYIPFAKPNIPKAAPADHCAYIAESQIAVVPDSVPPINLACTPSPKLNKPPIRKAAPPYIAPPTGAAYDPYPAKPKAAPPDIEFLNGAAIISYPAQAKAVPSDIVPPTPKFTKADTTVVSEVEANFHVAYKSYPAKPKAAATPDRVPPIGVPCAPSVGSNAKVCFDQVPQVLSTKTCPAKATTAAPDNMFPKPWRNTFNTQSGQRDGACKIGCQRGELANEAKANGWTASADAHTQSLLTSGNFRALGVSSDTSTGTQLYGLIDDDCAYVVSSDVAAVVDHLNSIREPVVQSRNFQ